MQFLMGLLTQPQEPQASLGHLAVPSVPRHGRCKWMDEGKEQLDYVGPGKGLGFFWHRVNLGTCIPARLDSPPRLRDQAGNCVASPLM